MSKRDTSNHCLEEISDAKDTCLYFLDTIVEQLVDGNKVSGDLYNDYPDGDGYHHEHHVDRAYSLTEAVELLDRLSDFEETDHGLWDGLSPRDAISAQAAYTYGNAVMHYWQSIIETINDRDTIPDLDDAIEDYNNKDSDVTLETIKEIVKQIIKEYKD